jgi:hypothetical protein
MQHLFTVGISNLLFKKNELENNDKPCLFLLYLGTSSEAQRVP